jgi:hypothetical protein
MPLGCAAETWRFAPRRETRDASGSAAGNQKRWRAGRAHSGVMSVHQAGFRFGVTGGFSLRTQGLGPGRAHWFPGSRIPCFTRRSRAGCRCSVTGGFSLRTQGLGPGRAHWIPGSRIPCFTRRSRAGCRCRVTGGAAPATHGFGPGKTPRISPFPISFLLFRAAKRASRPGGR